VRRSKGAVENGFLALICGIEQDLVVGARIARLFMKASVHLNAASSSGETDGPPGSSSSVDRRPMCNREQILDSFYVLIGKQTSPGAAFVW
jgi:hypothetical protein